MCWAQHVEMAYLFLEQNNVFPVYLKKYPDALGYALYHDRTPFQPEAAPMHPCLVRVIDGQPDE